MKLINSEFIIQIKIAVNVSLDFMTMGKKNVFYAKIQFLIARYVLNDCLTVKNAKTMAHAKNIKNVRLINIDHNKHKNA